MDSVWRRTVYFILKALPRPKGRADRHLVQGAIALLLVSMLSTVALAQPADPVFRTLPASSAPETLFHWTDASGFEKITHSWKDGRLLANRVRDDHRFGASFPFLIDRPAFYAWPDSIVGIGTTTEEIYPSRHEEKPELVRLKLRRDLRVVEVNTEGMEFEPQKLSAADAAKLAQADLVLHRWSLDGEIALREWVIINPRAVTEVETSPERLRPDLERDWQKLPETIKDRRNLHWSLDGSLVEEICIVCHQYGRDLVRELVDQFLEPRSSSASRPGGPVCANIFQLGKGGE